MRNAHKPRCRLPCALLLPVAVGLTACGAASGEPATVAQQAYLDPDSGRLAVPPPSAQPAGALRQATASAAEPEPFSRDGMTFLPLPDGRDSLLQARRVRDGSLRIGHGDHD